MDTAWLIKRLEARGSSIAALARRVGRDRASISRIVNGGQPMPLWMAPHFAAELSVSELEVLRRAGASVPTATSIPIVSWVAASQFAEVETSIVFGEEYPRIVLDYPRDTVFALYVQGDSMDHVAPDGSLIVVDFSQKNPNDRDLVVAVRSGETTFKRYRCDDAGSWLEPDSFNPRHAPILPGDEEVVIVGRVVAIPSIGRA